MTESHACNENDSPSEEHNSGHEIEEVEQKVLTEEEKEEILENIQKLEDEISKAVEVNNSFIKIE